MIIGFRGNSENKQDELDSLVLGLENTIKEE
jgi:hypothetical protein